MRAVRWISFICTAVDFGALFAHVLELPNKLTLSGPLWLAVQQQLYRGWGPALAPFEVGAVVSAWALVVLARRRRRPVALALAAALCLTVMFALFFAIVQPVNVAFAAWTPETLPADWPLPSAMGAGACRARVPRPPRARRSDSRGHCRCAR